MISISQGLLFGIVVIDYLFHLLMNVMHVNLPYLQLGRFIVRCEEYELVSVLQMDYVYKLSKRDSIWSDFETYYKQTLLMAMSYSIISVYL
jgi:hypothetical protein